MKNSCEEITQFSHLITGRGETSNAATEMLASINFSAAKISRHFSLRGGDRQFNFHLTLSLFSLSDNCVLLVLNKQVTEVLINFKAINTDRGSGVHTLCSLRSLCQMWCSEEIPKKKEKKKKIDPSRTRQESLEIVQEHTSPFNIIEIIR